MTREELREYVEELESQGEIPYHVYSNLIDCIDTLESDNSILEDIKAEIQNEIDERYSDGSYSYDTSRVGLRKALEIIDKHTSGKEQK